MSFVPDNFNSLFNPSFSQPLWSANSLIPSIIPLLVHVEYFNLFTKEHLSIREVSGHSSDIRQSAETFTGLTFPVQTESIILTLLFFK